MSLAKCKICRRAGQKLFLKGERCFSPKCAIVRRNYPPGVHGPQSKGRRITTEFGKQLAEKRKIQSAYLLSEKQFASYIKKGIALGREGLLQKLTLPDFVAQKLELRLDSAVFRTGFVVSRSVARHLVTHGHFLVNGERVDIPSYEVRVGDEVSVRSESMNLAPFSDLKVKLAVAKPSSWITLDKEKMSAKISGIPNLEETGFIGDINSVIGFYTR